MSEPADGDRVSNRQLYDALKELADSFDNRFATKDDVKVWVLAGLLGGSVVASTVTAIIARISPPQQASALAHYALHLFS